MIIDELNKKIADIESLANDKASTIESKVSDLTDGLLMVADAVDIIPEMVDEKITAITKEFSTIKDTVSKVKAQKGEKGAKGDKGDTNGFYSKGSLTVVGNYFGGNGTKITIDDVNEQITIGNIKAYDDDAAAGTAGLTAGMVYMTTGSGAAPLNVSGILMIKQ